MLEVVLMLIVTLVAAALGGVVPLRISFGSTPGLRRQGRKMRSAPLAILLGCVSDGLRSALAAAWARPAPAVAPQQVRLPRTQFGSPPGRPHGGDPYAPSRAPRALAPRRRN